MVSGPVELDLSQSRGLNRQKFQNRTIKDFLKRRSPTPFY
jgi:hypothetical protein